MKKRTVLFLALLFVIYQPFPAQAQDTATDFRDILRHVYEHNPHLQAARAELRAVHELYPQALSGWRPSLNLESSLYATDIENSNFGRADGTTTKDVTLSLDQPLFRGGRTFAETKKANSLIRAGYAVMLQAEQGVFFDTIRVIADVVRDRTLLSLRQNNERLMVEELDVVRARLEGGELTKTDEKQAETRLARSISEKTVAQANLESSIARFEETVGYLPPDNLSLPDLIFNFTGTQQEMIELAEQDNPEVQAARHISFAADHEIDAVFRELMPQILAFASYNKQYDPQPGIIDDSQAETIGIRASLPLYQGGHTRSRVREAKSTANQRAIEVEKTMRRIRQQVIRDLNSLRAARTEISSRSTEVEAAEFAQEGVRAEAQLGERTVLDILDADQELLDAKAALISVKRDEVIHHYALATNLGILLPEKMGMTGVAYNPGDHYRAVSNRFFSMNSDVD